MQERYVTLPFHLPHEIIKCLATVNSTETLANQVGMSETTRQHMQNCAAKMGLPPQGHGLIGLGLWGDGVPVNYDRTESVDMFTLSLPGLPGDTHELRIPLVGLNRKFMVVRHTVHDICDILAWSFEHCALGSMPQHRHDGQPFNASDAKRKKQMSHVFPKAILCEIRADWAFMKQCFGFPQHNELKGICTRCSARPDSYKDCSLTAEWREQRHDHWALIQRFVEQGIPISTLSSPISDLRLLPA